MDVVCVGPVTGRQEKARQDWRMTNYRNWVAQDGSPGPSEPRSQGR